MSDLALTVEPSELETATSRISRLAQRNGCFSAQEFALDLGVSWDSIRVGDPESIEEICDFASVDQARLLRSSYRSGETANSKWVANEWIAPKFMRFDKIAVCASCVAGSMSENLNHLSAGAPVWWFFDGLRICPVHNEILVELPPKGTGRCKHDFAGRVSDNHSLIQEAAHSPRRHEAGKLESYVLQRLSGQGGTAQRWINTLDLATVVRASELLGLAVSGQGASGHRVEDSRALAEATEVGFNILSHGSRRLKSKLTKLRPYHPKGGFYAEYYPFSRWLERFQDRAGCKPLIQSVREFVVETYPFEIGDLVLGQPVETKHVHSISSSASKANVSFPRMRTVLGAARERKALRHLPRPDRNLWVRTCDWDQFLEDLGLAVTLKPAAHRTGVCSSMFMGLVSAGYIRPIDRVPEMAPRYLPQEIDRFLLEVSQNSRSMAAVPKGMISLNSIQSSCRVGMVPVLELLLKNRLTNTGTLEGKAGLSAILITKEEVLDHLEGPPLKGFSSEELRRHLGINSSTVPWLVSNGYLQSEHVPHPRSRKLIRLFKHEEIERFLEKYETVGRISHRLHKKPPFVLKLLKGHGIEPVPVERNMSVFFRREDLPVDFL